jgi:hypothetical protein
MRVLIGLAVSIVCSISTLAEAYDIFEENGKVGLKDSQGQVIIPAEYEALGWSEGGFKILNNVVGYKVSGSWGIVDINNHVLTQAEYSSLIPAEGNLLVAYKKTPTRHVAGCIDTTGKVIIPFQYDGLIVNSMRAIAVLKSGGQYKYGLIDHEGKVVIPVDHQKVQSLGSLRYGVQNMQGQYALFTESGKSLTSFLYEKISSFNKNLALITKDGKKGIIDRDGIIKVQPAYQELEITDDGSVRGRKQNQWTILDGKNTTLQKIEIDSIIPLNNNLFGVKNDGKYELVNGQFNVVASERYSLINNFENNKAIVQKEGKCGLISSNGQVLIPANYYSIKLDKHYVMASVLPNQWILMDSLGNRKTSRTYQDIDRFNGIYFAVKNQNYYGAINAEGKETIACVYDSILQYMDGKLVVKFRGSYGIIDMKESWIVPPSLAPQQIISTDRYLQKQGTTTYLKSFDGNMIYFTENKITVKDNHLTEYVSTGGTWKIDLDGRIISRLMPPVVPYEEVFEETEGLRGIKKEGRYGFVDDLGRLRIANRYEGVKPFQERMAAVKILGKWGFIDHDEKLVIQPVHEETLSFKNGMAIVMQKGLYGIINKKGLIALPLRYQSVTQLPTKRFIVESDGLKGLADYDGRLIVTPKYSSVVDLNNGYLIVERNGQYGLLTLQGLSTVPMIYDYILYDPFNARYMALKKADWQKVL